MGDAVFSVQAIMTLQDLISGRLADIGRSLAATGREAAGLGAKMASLAKSMLPVVAVAGTLLLGLGGAAAKAADFEQAMSKVRAVSGGAAEDMAALRKNALEMGADTAFSALEAAGAQEELAKAGLGANQIVAAMPGVLSMAAAGEIGLSQAAEAATDTMKTFHMEASQIGFIGDVMAATANRTSTDIGLMTQSLKNSSAVAASVGVSLLDLSAMIGSLADQGIKGAEAGTQLKTTMLRLSAPTADAAKQLAALGVNTRDAQGNILPIFDILGSLEAKLAGMGSGKRAEVLKAIFGDDAVSAVNALLNTGIDKVKAFSAELAGSAGSAAETAATKMDNAKGAIEELSGSFETLTILIGEPLLAPITKVVQGVTKVINVLSLFADTDIGRTVVLVASGLATLVVASAAVAAGLWAVSLVGPVVTGALAPLGAALGALGAPIWIVIGLVAALVLAWKTNFGGMRATLTEWWDKIVLVVRGVSAVFGSLTGSTGELKGQLAKDIEAKGLLGVVTSVGRVVFRIRQFFVSLWDAVQAGTQNLGKVFAPLAGVFDPILNALAPLGGLFRDLFNLGVDSELSTWGAAGRVVGDVLGTAFRAIAFGIRMALVPIQLFGALAGYVVGLVTGQGGTLADLGASLGNVFTGVWQSFQAAFPGVAAAIDSLFNLLSGIGDAVAGLFAGFDPLGAISAGIEAVTTYLMSIDLSACGAAIINTIRAGIMSAVESLKSTVSTALSGVRSLLPFSDAKEEPLSTLTASGRAIMTTPAAGVGAAGPSLAGATSAAMAGAAATLNGLTPPSLPDLTGTASWQTVPPPDVRLPDAAAAQPETGVASGRERARQGGVVIQSLAVTLPGVADGEGFVRGLQRFVEQYDA